jgi:hypothetical protein
VRQFFERFITACVRNWRLSDLKNSSYDPNGITKNAVLMKYADVWCSSTSVPSKFFILNVDKTRGHLNIVRYRTRQFGKRFLFLKEVKH